MQGSFAVGGDAGAVLELEIFGEPKPKGSKRAFAVRRRDGSTGVAVAESSGEGLRDWTERINAVVQRWAFDSRAVPLVGPVSVHLTFAMPRRSTTRKAEVWHTKRPDPDKLARTCLDVLSGVVYRDDAQVCELMILKRYAFATERSGVQIRVSEVAT